MTAEITAKKESEPIVLASRYAEALEALAVLGRQLAEKDEALRAIIAKSEQSAHLPAHDRNVIESIARSGLKA